MKQGTQSNAGRAPGIVGAQFDPATWEVMNGHRHDVRAQLATMAGLDRRSCPGSLSMVQARYSLEVDPSTESCRTWRRALRHCYDLLRQIEEGASC